MSDLDWLELINHDSNINTIIKYLHSFNYNIICFIYFYGKDRQY